MPLYRRQAVGNSCGSRYTERTGKRRGSFPVRADPKPNNAVPFMRQRSGNFWMTFTPAAMMLAVALGLSLAVAAPPDIDPFAAPFNGPFAPPPLADPAGHVRVAPSNDDSAVPFPFAVSAETTVLTEPLRPDGGVDYLKALNEQAGRGVTPENNAAVLLLRALGPSGTDIDKRDKLFTLLGMERLPDVGDYLLQDQQFIEQRSHHRGRPDRQNELQVRFNVQLEQAKRSVWSAVECPLVAGWLETNEKALDMAVAASKRTRFFVPLIGDHPKSLLRSTCDTFGFGQCGDLRALLVLRALHRFQDNDFDGGREALLAGHRLARLLGQNFGIVNCNNAADWEAELCEAERTAADSGKLTGEQIRALQKSLDQLPPLPRPAEQMAGFERFCLLDDLAYTLGGKPDDSVKSDQDDLDWLLSKLANALTDGDEAARWINRWVDRWVAAEKLLHNDERGQTLAQMSADWEFLQSDLDSNRATLQWLIGTKAWRGRLRGAELARDFTATALRVAEEETRAVTTARLTKVALALAAFKQERGEFPVALSSLVPKHLADLPRDSYTSAEFRYRRTKDGYLLYSLGRNGQDDGGRDHWDDDAQLDGDDIVVRFPPPPPPPEPSAGSLWNGAM